MFGAIQAAAWTWHETKLVIERTFVFSQESLHVIASVLIQLCAAHILRKPVASWWPWFVVLIAAGSNEAVDLWVEQWPDPPLQYSESAWDLILTMALPSLLLFTSRRCPRLYRLERSSTSRRK